MWNSIMKYPGVTNQIMTAFFAFLFLTALSGAWARDFLTDQEIARMQKTQDIDRRAKIYMDAASLRLGTALDRFEGKESKPGDALEFFSQDEMLDDYYKIIERVMLVVGDAFEFPRYRENINIKKALQTLKSECSGNLKKLSALKKLAEDKQNEELWNGVNRAIAITGGMRDGAEEGLSILAEREREEVRRSR